MIDLRSDTVTKPTKKMREEMLKSKVGDDVYGEDPTVNKLEEKAAEKFNKEDGLFVPSGTMGNQIAIRIHVNPGNEVILDSKSHILNFEMGTLSNFAGAVPRQIETKKFYLPLKDTRKAIRPKEYYTSQTDLIAIENTQNMKGGTIYPKEKIKELLELSKKRDIPIHIDGARIFNSSVETGMPVKEIAQDVDSVMFCLSKGLGAPIGSMLVGNEEFIEEARIVRKQLGGGMRQVGILAGAGLYALDNHIERLEEDHKKAKILAKELNKIEDILVTEPDTNIVMMDLTCSKLLPEELIGRMEDKGILAGCIAPQKVRFVTHLDVGPEEVRRAAKKIKCCFSKEKP